MLKNELTILGTKIEKGSSVFLEMEVAKLHTRNHISVPVIIERAKEDGPVLLLLAGVHGDETNGVAIVRDIIRKKYNRPERGTIICIPVLNSFGYLNQTREFPDGRDLNRMFPGSASGSLASQFAYKFMKEIAPHVDYVLDFHTGGAARENYPNVRYGGGQPVNAALVEVFNAPFTVHSNYIPKSIRDAINKLGKPILLFEGGKSLQLDPFVVEVGVEGAMNVMKYLKMHSGEVVKKHVPVVVKKSNWIRAPYSGLFESVVKNGSFATKKTVLGRISDPYGEFEKIVKAPADCYIFGMNTSPIVNKGDALFHVSTQVEASVL